MLLMTELNLIRYVGFECQMHCSDGNSYRGIDMYDQKVRLLFTGFIKPKKSEETGVI